MFYEQECSICSFSHKTFSNEKWCEQFSTKVDVGLDIGVTQQQPVILSHVSEESNNKFEYMTPEEKKYTGTCGVTLPILNFSQAER